MSIRLRIIVLIALTFSALGLIGGYAIVQSRSSATEVKRVTEGVVPSTIQSVELMTQLKDIQIAALDMVASEDLAVAKQKWEEVRARQSVLQNALLAQAAQADNAVQRGLVNEAQESLKNYFSSIDETANMKLQGQKELAEATMAATVDQYLREQGAVLDTLQVEKRRSKDASIGKVNDSLHTTVSTLTLTSVLAALGLSAIGGLLYRQIVRPIGEMQSKMTEIATSQDFSHRLTVQRQDEIGRSMMAFNTMIEKIEDSAHQVRQKSADIHAMLHAIPQGILTIEACGAIHPEYSEYLKTILEREDMGGRSVMDIVFSDTTADADALAQVDATIGACIGEDIMNFEFNAHLLLTEIEKRMPDGQTKILDLHWAPICDDSGTVQRMLLVLRDVTELRALAKAAQAQRRELGMIGEILAVQPDKFQAFMTSTRRFLAESRFTLQQAYRFSESSQYQEALRVLFRNMHTVKGNARTYGLLQLTGVAHEAEQAYDLLRQGDESAWPMPRLEMELKRVEDVVEEYAQINDVQLGRRGADRGGHAVSCTAPDVTDRIQDVLAPVLEALPSLAGELDKPAPQCIIQDQGIAVQPQVADTLRHVFMHLYRNALDHGIEPAQERLPQGKSAAGTIRLDADMQAEGLRLTLSDDGRGLDLERIRAKAHSQGLLKADQSYQPRQIAQLIFESGLSTAKQVSEVSGRGVGMDAVKAFVEAQGGHIELALDDSPRSPGYYGFTTVINLPAELLQHVKRQPRMFDQAPA